MGRPPKDKEGGSVSGPGSMHLGLRLGKHRADQLKRLTDDANAKAVAMGLPPAFTASALVVAQMNKWLDEECAKLDTAAKKRR